jgi:flagellar basal-body rod modification protein FlgD
MTSVTAASAVSGLPAPGTKQGSAGFVSEATMDFYNLLTTQLTNQNPLEPVKETDFLGQMAQFSTVEQLQSMGLGLSRSQTEQRWLDAQGFLGREVEWKSGEDEAVRRGEVERIDRDADGGIWLHVNGSQVLLDSIVSVTPGAGATPILKDTRKIH